MRIPRTLPKSYTNFAVYERVVERLCWEIFQSIWKNRFKSSDLSQFL